jgi:hypothetical protein
MAHYPFAIRLVVGGGRRPRAGALESFAQLGVDERREVWLHTMAGYVATKYPGDYRSPTQVQRDAGDLPDT